MKVLIPLPSCDFDPTDVAVPWTELTNAGHVVAFATPDGLPGKADERMLTGKDLGLFKNSLMARQDAIVLYQEMTKSQEFNAPLKYEALKEQDYDAIVLPGGQGPGVKTYLESNLLKLVIVDFFRKNKIVAAICHGTLLVARSLDPQTGKSVLWGRRTTGPSVAQENFTWRLTKKKLGDHYRAYETPLEMEVRSYLQDPKDHFYHGRRNFFGVSIARDSNKNLKPGFVVKDGNYLSARWAGDAYKFSSELIGLLL